MAAAAAKSTDHEQSEIERWKIRRTVKQLSQMKGRGTSLITLTIPSNGQVSRTIKLLTEELGTASCIKSSQTRNNVKQAITTAQARLSLYSQRTLPKNGLVIYAGIAQDDDQNKEKKVSISFEPLQPLTNSLYRCDNHFITDFLHQQLNESQVVYGIIVVDGNGALFARLENTRALVLQKFNVDLPKKHGRGGQSQLRFERLRKESIHNYLRKVAEACTSNFISKETGLVNIDKGFIVAGSANLKHELINGDLMNVKIKTKIQRVVDVQYGAENGLQEAIKLCSDLFTDLKLANDRKELDDFFTLIRLSNDPENQQYCIGVDETMSLLNSAPGIIDRILLWENLEMKRYVYRTKQQEHIIIADNEQKALEKLFVLMNENENKNDVECVDAQNLVEWFTENYKDLNLNVVLVSNYTQEGQQFQLGFGGCVAMLRYPIPSSTFDPITTQTNEDQDSVICDYDM
ncbi:unnamed protein product [Didymodactylos carnosus]|nr:unnamed protein product [Didymodactylos carnosus]CAF3797981.1 unnamed protein product [Didymodactylos carnosus]